MYLKSLYELKLKAEKQGIPFSGMFELTPRCNLHCKFCYVCDRAEKAAVKPEKTTAEWLDMISQAADAGMLECTFTGGDPFMREDFEEIYCKAYDMGLRLNIFSNGILIGEKQRSYLSKRRPDLISITLYGASNESYEEVCGDGEGFRRVMFSLTELHRAGLFLEIKTLVLRPLFHEYESIGRIASEFKCHGKISEYLTPGRDDHNRVMLDWRMSAKEIDNAKDSFKRGYKKLKNIPRKQPVNTSEKRDNVAVPCFAGKSEFTITYNGRMLGCPQLTCFHTLPFEDSFEMAWNSLKVMIRNAQTCEECTKCPDFDACYRCPAIRLSESGSITRCSAYLRELAHALTLRDAANVG